MRSNTRCVTVSGRWLATDIVIEGISMTSSYADQFTSLLRDRSFDELLDLMRRKVDHFRGAESNMSLPMALDNQTSERALRRGSR